MGREMRAEAKRAAGCLREIHGDRSLDGGICGADWLRIAEVDEANAGGSLR